MRSDVTLLRKYPPTTFLQKIAFTAYRLLVRLDIFKGYHQTDRKFDSSLQGYEGKYTFFWQQDNDVKVVGALIVWKYRLLVEKITLKADWTISISKL